MFQPPAAVMPKAWASKWLSTSRTYLGIVTQDSFVELLYSVGVHFHTVGDELDEIGHSIVAHITPSL